MRLGSGSALAFAACLAAGGCAHRQPVVSRECGEAAVAAEAARVASLVQRTPDGSWSIGALRLGARRDEAQQALGQDWTCRQEGAAFVCRSQQGVVSVDSFHGCVTAVWLGVRSCSTSRSETCADFHAVVDALTRLHGQPSVAKGEACGGSEPDGRARAVASWHGSGSHRLVAAIENSPETIESFYVGVTLEAEGVCRKAD